MLASLVQGSRALSCRQISGVQQRFLYKRSSFGTLGPGEPPLADRPQHQVRAFGASPSGVKHDLKAQILSEADNVTFRYEIDNHKFQSEAVIKQAEKAIGWVKTCHVCEQNKPTCQGQLCPGTKQMSKRLFCYSGTGSSIDSYCEMPSYIHLPLLSATYAWHGASVHKSECGHTRWLFE